MRPRSATSYPVTGSVVSVASPQWPRAVSSAMPKLRRSVSSIRSALSSSVPSAAAISAT